MDKLKDRVWNSIAEKEAAYLLPVSYTHLDVYKRQSEQERKAALAWTPEQITEKQRNLIQNIQRLADMEDPEFTLSLIHI